ncbi:NPC intracellular cholesterol transporter 2 homolog a-like [Sabethes cyaneus]|uniref:NPC intracellular cholesterol transporter 2 homolog a-like n=1 Tax=Sabethes cyaneus TaxID=53552 RepID=UPI00221E2FF4|nr:NPC intracellular cholesterol transporter 2 homolog a-like [Sabethes cyaneus]
MCKFLSILKLIVVSAMTISFVQSVQFENCADANTIGNFSLVEVSDCDLNESKCVLKRNSNATISITFSSEEDLSELKAVVHGVILGMEVPFKLPNDNGCVNSGLECPLSKNTDLKYTATLPVLKQYPKVVVDVKWELKSANQEVVCVKIPAKIQ